MKPKKRKRRRLKIGRLFFVLLFFSVISFMLVKFVHIPIMNITISGNKLLTDKEILEYASLEDYPSFFGTITFNVRKKLLENDYIKDVKVRKGILSLKINIEEQKVLYIDLKTNEKVTSKSRFKDNKIVCAPYLENEVPSDKTKDFLKAMEKIEQDILCQIAQIKYDPNEIDSDRYYLDMNDGNSIYLTVNKFKKINDYNKILENIGKQNGTLYLDYGDYFKVK